MKNRSVLEIHLNLLQQNSLLLKSLTEGAFFCPMLKADGYGHGSVKVAQALLQAGVQQVGVISVSEAWSIREFVEEMDILIFGPVLEVEELHWIVEEGLVLVCNNWQDLKGLSQIKKPSRIHLKFDTGFSRLGFNWNEKEKIKDFLKKHPQIQLEGLAGQLSSGEDLGDKKNCSFNQTLPFSLLQKKFSESNIHFLNSSALIASYAHNLKMGGARPGLSLYGLKPKISFQNEKAEKRWKDLSLSPVSCWKSYVVALRTVRKGAVVSYGETWRATRPSQIATVSVGYGDGFIRNAGTVKKVLFRGEKRPVRGAICMDFFMMDLTDCKGPPVKLGEEVVIFGRQKKQVLSLEKQAEVLGTIPYELLCRIGPRVERIYKNG